MKKRIINCTPHPIVVRMPDGSKRTFEPSGVVPRVSMIETETGEITDIPSIRQVSGEISNLPDPQPETLFIVSRMVFDVSDREDLIVPDTGTGAIRDEKGHILAVTRFIRK